MEAFFQAMLGGVGTGAVYAGIGLGLVLAFQGSGVINFSHGAVMMYVTYLFDELRDTGDYVLPFSLGGWDRFNVLGTPAEDGANGFWPAFLVAMVAAALLGLIIHLLVFRPLRHAPLLAKVVATVGIFVVLSNVVLLRFGTQIETVRGILPAETVTFAGITLGKDRLWLAGVVVLTAFALAAIYKLTRFGLATQAASEEEKGAIMLGYSPDLLAAGNWMLASMVAAAAGILFAPLTSGVNSTTYTLLVVPALACALVGGLRSFLITCAAGLFLGMLDTTIQKYQIESWWPDWAADQGFRQAVPFLVIVGVLFLRGHSLPSRGTLSEGRQTFAPNPRNVMPTTVILFVAALVMIFTFDRALRLSLYQSMIAIIIALSIVIVTGFLGQVSLAQAAFAGIAGFMVVKLTNNSIPFPLSPLLAGLVAAGLGLVVGIPALRIRGIQLAVVTMAMGVAVDAFVFRNRSFIGELGILKFNGTDSDPSIFGGNLDPNIPPEFARPQFGVVLLIFATLCALLTVNLRRSSTGRRFLAVRVNERAAAAARVDVAQTKLIGFCLSAFIAGLGGSMIAYLNGQLSPDSFGVLVSLTLLAFAYLGGIGLVSGALVAGALASGGLLAGVMEKLISWDGIDTYFQLIGGIGLILTAILNPDGIAGKTARDLQAKRQGQQRATTEVAAA